MTTQTVGIHSRPIQFENGEPLPHDPAGDSSDPQNLWYSIERAQNWAGYNVLGLEVHGMQKGEPFTEATAYDNQGAKLIEADEKRKSRSSEVSYTDSRNIESFAAFFGTKRGRVTDEFKSSRTLEVGSGAGRLSDDLRRYAKANVTELDFSLNALSGLQPVFKNRGNRVVGDGTRLPFNDATFKNTISIFSTSVHTDTIRSRLSGVCEALRVTQTGGRVFMSPIFGGMILQQERWHILQSKRDDADFFDEYMQAYEQTIKQEAVISFALTGLLRNLMAMGNISLTPILKIERKPQGDYDNISGIFDVAKPLGRQQATDLIEELAAPFS